MPRSGWIGVDLDGTLAHYEGWVDVGHVGEPIPLMLERVRVWLAAGRTVKIVTARVSHPEDGHLAREVIESWCLKHLGQKLEVTYCKDFQMTELWDDRAVSVETNTGVCLDPRKERPPNA